MNASVPSLLQPTNESRNAPAAMLAALAERFGERCSVGLAMRQQHGRDESPIDAPPPDAVVFCESTADVATAVSLASEHGTPVIPWGTGSSLEGHVLAVQGGISLDLTRMNRVIAIRSDDLTVTVQPGVTRKQLNDEIRHTGLFFSVDPGADASIGGMCATRASGTNAVRYGTMRENVLALEVVTSSGQIVRTGTQARKSAAGYDLTRLMIGSEGTLGVITEITLKLHPQPEAVSAAVCHFDSVSAAVETTIRIIQSGIPIARCELLDVNAVRAVNAHDKLTLRESPMLLMEFHGSEAGVLEQAHAVQDLARDAGGTDFEWATSPEARSRLWTARHRAYFAGLQMKPGSRAVTTDTCVPISRLASCVDETVADVESSGLTYYIVGHVGDGNFHVAYLIDPMKPEERMQAEVLNARLVARALGQGGTCSGEHGIGLHKQAFLIDEAGPGAIDMMRSIKQALDPKNIMNPGKIFAWSIG